MKKNGFLFKSIIYYSMILFALFFISCDEISSPASNEEKQFSQTTISELDAAIEKAMIENNIPGTAVGVWFPNEGTYIKAMGVSNLVTNEPMKTENHFRIGSITKTFTGTAVLILAEQGKIDLDSSLADYLPEYPFPKSEQITVRMLGNMTSGIPSYSNDSNFVVSLYENKFEETFTADSLVKVTISEPLLFEPGTGWSYSNTNTVLLGLICEKVTGKLTNTIFEELIFQPYALDDTFWPLSRFMPEPYSHGYTKQTIGGNMEDATYYNPSWGHAAGILISNISDLGKYARLLGTGSFYSSNYQNERLTYIEAAPGVLYGFGIGELNGWIGHNGALPGYNSELFYFPPKDAVIIVHVNSDINTPAHSVIKAITRILTPDNIPYE